MPKKNNQSLFSPRNNKVDVVNDNSWGDHAPAVVVQEESKEQDCSGLSDLENVIGTGTINSGRSDRIEKIELEKPRSKQRHRKRKDQKGNKLDGFESDRKSMGV